jgi:hypothetical protein
VPPEELFVRQIKKEKLACPLHSKFTRSFKEDKSATAGRLKDGIITPKAFFSAR